MTRSILLLPPTIAHCPDDVIMQSPQSLPIPTPMALVPMPLVVIPARLQSTRLPEKLLQNLGGKPLIIQVWKRIRALENVHVLVATDDNRIRACVEKEGGEVCMTSSSCRSGLDRVAEVVRTRFGGANDDGTPQLDNTHNGIIVNVQGDEPFVDVEAVGRLIDALQRDPQLELATLATAITDVEHFRNPNVVKVVVNAQHDALYFSRAPIPWPRDAPGPRDRSAVPDESLQHIGVYAYRRGALLRLASLPSCGLEQTEQLEQLRALHAGMRIRVLTDAKPSIGVDTQADLEQARALWVSFQDGK